MREKRDEIIILRTTKAEKNRIYEKMLGMGIRSLSAYIPNIHYNDTEVMIMSRDFSRKTDESTLTTLCPRCLDAFRNARGIRVRRADPRQTIKEPCTYCQTRFGFDYYIQPTSPKTTYFKKGRFDDESECA